MAEGKFGLLPAINAVEYYHQIQIEDFLKAVIESHDPLITREEGRKTVEIFTAIYRSQRECRSNSRSHLNRAILIADGKGRVMRCRVRESDITDLIWGVCPYD
jgi:hypothetical protein